MMETVKYGITCAASRNRIDLPPLFLSISTPVAESAGRIWWKMPPTRRILIDLPHVFQQLSTDRVEELPNVP